MNEVKVLRNFWLKNRKNFSAEEFFTQDENHLARKNEIVP